MVTRLQRTFRDRARRQSPHHPDGESGSLILDILIGMAIFALIAIIAISAIGQYRMRAYTQTAVSDAEALSTAIQAAITDHASDQGPEAYPTGPLSDADLASLEVNPSGRGAQQSAAVVTPDPTNPETFTVCVEYRGAYAEYGSEEGLTASGNAAEDGFLGCDTPMPVGIPCPEFTTAYALYKGYSPYTGHGFAIYPGFTNKGVYRPQSIISDAIQNYTVYSYISASTSANPYISWSPSMAQRWAKYTLRYRSPDSADVSTATCTRSITISVPPSFPASDAFPIDTRFDLGTSNGVTLSIAP